MSLLGLPLSSPLWTGASCSYRERPSRGWRWRCSHGGTQLFPSVLEDEPRQQDAAADFREALEVLFSRRVSHLINTYGIKSQLCKHSNNNKTKITVLWKSRQKTYLNVPPFDSRSCGHRIKFPFRYSSTFNSSQIKTVCEDLQEWMWRVFSSFSKRFFTEA